VKHQEYLIPLSWTSSG